MKKLTVFVTFALVLCMLFSACGKKEEPVFVSMDTTSVITGVRISDGSIAYEDAVAYEIALAYNSITECEAYDEDAEPFWQIVMICTPSAQSAEGTENSLYMISYLGDNQFNITVNGGSDGRCKVTSEKLYQAFADPVKAE